MEPTVSWLEQQYKGQVVVVKYDREDAANAAVVARYNNRTQPHYILADINGNPIQEWFGAQDAATFMQAIDSN